MDWDADADAAIRKVPFFVRKRVRARVEKQAAAAGRTTVTLADVTAARARFLAGMSSEIRGYQLDTCFGPGGCPNRAVAGDRLLERLEEVLKAADLLGFLKARVKGELKFHHEFRVTLADCPNACSQPQIKDVGIIGACTPAVTGEACSGCMACVAACAEQAVSVDPDAGRVEIGQARCLHCGRCVAACPSGTISEGRRGFRVQLAGRLGRRPQLARELPGLFDEDRVIDILRECLRLYKQRSRSGERFAHLFQNEDFERLQRQFCRSRL